MTVPNEKAHQSLKDELVGARRRGPVSTLTQEERTERNKKQAAAAALAASVLKRRHQDEYDGLYAQAKKELGCE